MGTQLMFTWISLFYHVTCTEGKGEGPQHLLDTYTQGSPTDLAPDPSDNLLGGYR